MDINLPGMSGFDAVQRLHEWPETRNIPVIGLSAAALRKDTTRAKEVGLSLPDQAGEGRRADQDARGAAGQARSGAPEGASPQRHDRCTTPGA
jgi:CheY-like chemotaxis protein